MKPYYQLIKGPIITEKTHSLKEAANKLTLRVDLKANKIEIRKAIEDLFKVKVSGGEHHPDARQKETGGPQRRGPLQLEKGHRHPGPRRKDSRVRGAVRQGSGVRGQ